MVTRTAGRCVVVLCAWLAGAGAAAAQCDTWLPSPGTHAPFHGRFCDAAVSYTPPGQSAPRLVVGGSDVRFQGVDLYNLGAWDGAQWSGLGGGTNGDVRDLIVWNSPSGQVLVAAGSFSTAGAIGANGVAVWNGSSWSALQLGLRTLQGEHGYGDALAVWDPDGVGPLGQQLIVAGSFQRAGNILAANIARWDGSDWHALGSGTDSTVNALTTWDRDGAGPLAADLIVGGYFDSAGGSVMNHLARWNGSWQPVGAGVTHPGGGGHVEALTTWDPDGPGPLTPRLAVGGYFTHAGPVAATGVAAWNGNTWQSFGAGPGSVVYALTTWDPDGAGPQFAQLVFSGLMSSGPSTYLESPRIWDGSSWQRLGQFVSTAGIGRFTAWDPDGPGALPARLVAVGNIQEQTPQGFAKGAMQLVGTEWRHFGSNPTIYSSALFSGRVVMGGDFQMIAETGPISEHVFIEAWNLATWNGLEIGSLGTVTGPVRALKSYSSGPAGASHLLVGGNFGAAGGLQVNNIARYALGNTPLNSGWFAVGQGFNGTVYALERLGTTTFAGGSFSASGGTPISNMAVLSGSNWVQAGFGTNGTVHALKVFNGSLYAGGSFTSAGGSATGSLGRWTGTHWSTVGGVAFPGEVYALEVHGGELVIGGFFPPVAGSANIVRFSGFIYSAMGPSGANFPVRALTVGPDGNLYAGGDFTAIGGASAARVARWNGSGWAEARGGINARVHTLASYRNEVHAGGLFSLSRFSELPSPAWARYTVDGVPWIARQPQGVTALCPGRDVQLFSSAAMGYGPLTYAWHKDGVPLTMGATPWGSTISAGFGALDIEDAALQDEGAYSVVVTHACGSVTSSAAMVRVCYANCDCSTAAPMLNVADFTCYLQKFAAGEPGANCDLSTLAPVLNVADFTCFLQTFAAGCP